MRSLLLVAVLGSVLVAEPRTADACSCPFVEAQLWPADGATDVPLNAKLQVLNYYAWPTIHAFRVSGTEDPVSLVVEERLGAGGLESSRLIATPETLAPNTTYELIVEAQFEIVRSTFTTGDRMDTTPPAFAGLADMALETMPVPERVQSSVCAVVRDGRVSRIQLDHGGYPDDAVVLVLQLTSDGVTREIAIPNTPETDVFYLGSHLCSSSAPQLDPEATYCGRLVAYDVAGNASGGSVEICREVTSCATELEPDGHTPARTCSAEPDPVDPIVVPEEGGCTASGGPAGLALVLLPVGAVIVRRRRQRA